MVFVEFVVLDGLSDVVHEGVHEVDVVDAGVSFSDWFFCLEEMV